MNENTHIFYKKPVEGHSTESFLILLILALEVSFLVSEIFILPKG